jgi:hypothetical protein
MRRFFRDSGNIFTALSKLREGLTMATLSLQYPLFATYVLAATAMLVFVIALIIGQDVK